MPTGSPASRCRCSSRTRRSSSAAGVSASSTLAGRLADIVSFNFDNSAGRLGAASVASSGAGETAQKLEWVRAGAGDRFDEIELEIGAYFVAVDDDPGPDDRRDGQPLRRERGGVRLPSRTPCSAASTSICATLQERREQFGFSYVTVPQRNMDDFAPVVARLSGT